MFPIYCPFCLWFSKKIHMIELKLFSDVFDLFLKINKNNTENNIFDENNEIVVVINF